MPFRFYLFVLWRFVKAFIKVVTFPVWGVGLVLMFAIFMFIGWAEGEYATARRDWVRKQ